MDDAQDCALMRYAKDAGLGLQRDDVNQGPIALKSGLERLHDERVSSVKVNVSSSCQRPVWARMEGDTSLGCKSPCRG